MAGVEIHRTALAAEWIDYNGHLRDACYALIASSATDALMDRVGLDPAYRAASGCTLYTLEMHLHFLAEAHRHDELCALARVLALDDKRLHLGLELARVRDGRIAAGVELLLMHVHQGPTVTVRAFPQPVKAALETLARQTRDMPSQVPASRRIALTRPA